MYRVLIVDDEPEIRQGLQLKVDWNKLGFVLVGEAANGMEAMNRLQEEEIDIVITDMNMPMMDGVSFLEAYHKVYPFLRVVIITGYEDFKYARAALRNRAKDYLLKPVTRSELTDTLEKVKQELDEERKNKNQFERIKWQISEYYKEMKEHFILHLVKGSIDEEHLVHDRAKLLQLDHWDEREIRIITVGLREQTLLEDSDRPLDKLCLPFRLICRECATMFPGSPEVFYDSNYRRLIHIIVSEQDTAWPELVDKLSREVLSNIGILPFAGVGQAMRGFKQWKEGYVDALLAWNLSRNNISESSFPIEGEQELLPDEEIRIIERQLLQGDLASFENAIRTPLQKAFCISQIKFVKIFFQLYLMLEKLAGESQISLEAEEQLWIRPQLVLAFNTVDKAYQYLLRIAAKIQRRLSNEADADQSLVEAAQHFIEENYMYDLSLKMIAKRFNYNPSYFSEIFKARVGVTFIQYVNEVRMGQAVRLLEGTELSLWDIAELSGFSSASYFSSKFKRLYGITPSDYRQTIAEENT